MTFSEFFNFKFFYRFFSLLASLCVLVFRLLLVEIDSEFFAFDTFDNLASIKKII